MTAIYTMLAYIGGGRKQYSICELREQMIILLCVHFVVDKFQVYTLPPVLRESYMIATQLVET